jgi:hexosaminidase
MCVVGMEAAVWSELIRTPKRLDSLLWPRLFALAERSWHKSIWELKSSLESDEKHSVAYDKLLNEDWARFATVVGHKELRRIEAHRVNYYLPRPGARSVMSVIWKLNLLNSLWCRH